MTIPVRSFWPYPLGRKVWQKMSGKKIAGSLQTSVDHFLPRDFFAKSANRTS